MQRGWQSSVPAEQTSLAQRPDRPAPECCRPPPCAEKGACPRPQGRGPRAVPLAPSPWLQGREPARTCCPGVAQGRSSKSPSAFRWQDGNPGLCRLLPIHEAAGGNHLCREPNAGGLDNVCRCRRRGRPGTIPDEWEERQEEGEASPRGASGGGHSESSPASCALGGLGPLRECPCPAGGWIGCRLLAGDRSARRAERAESCPSTTGAPRHPRVHSLDVRAPWTLSCDHSLAGAASCGTTPSRPRGYLCPVLPRCVCTGEREPSSRE